MNIPFNKPFITGQEVGYIQDSINRNKISGDGYYTKKVNSFIEEKFDTKKSLFVTSGSSALDMAAVLIGLQSGDEVIMPSYTFVSTANAVIMRGARVVFADIDPDTLNIDPADIERKITSRTKAVFPVHYAGVSCDMDAIMRIARQNNLKVVEDAAQGVNAKYKGKYLGTIGDIGCYSFHETKNYTAGEGGAILINRDEKYISRAEIIREKGTNRSQFYRGQVDNYTWMDIGSSYLASDILAAFLYAQFEQLDEINEMRKAVFDFYFNSLIDLQNKGKLRLPVIPDYCECNYHMFYILLNSGKERNRVMDELKNQGVLAVFHYIPLHYSPMGKKMGYNEGDLPVTEEYSARLLRLPMYAGLSRQEMDYIVDVLYKIV